MALLRGCFRLVLGGAFLVVVLALAWVFRDDLEALWRRRQAPRPEPAPAVSPEVAEAAETRLEALARTGVRERVVLSEAEVQSLLRYRSGGYLPPYVDSLRVDFTDEGRARLAARVPLDKLPRIEELGQVAGFLPDTVDVAVTGRLVPLDERRLALEVDEVSAQRVPLPRRLIPRMLERLGRKPEPGLAPNALALPIPPGASGAYIRSDSLVILPRAERGGRR